jgi:hypothetical protein
MSLGRGLNTKKFQDSAGGWRVCFRVPVGGFRMHRMVPMRIALTACVLTISLFSRSSITSETSLVSHLGSDKDQVPVQTDAWWRDLDLSGEKRPGPLETTTTSPKQIGPLGRARGIDRICHV